MRNVLIILMFLAAATTVRAQEDKGTILKRLNTNVKNLETSFDKTPLLEEIERDINTLGSDPIPLLGNDFQDFRTAKLILNRFKSSDDLVIKINELLTAPMNKDNAIKLQGFVQSLEGFKIALDREKRDLIFNSKVLLYKEGLKEKGTAFTNGEQLKDDIFIYLFNEHDYKKDMDKNDDLNKLVKLATDHIFSRTTLNNNDVLILQKIFAYYVETFENTDFTLNLSEATFKNDIKTVILIQDILLASLRTGNFLEQLNVSEVLSSSRRLLKFTQLAHTSPEYLYEHTIEAGNYINKIKTNNTDIFNAWHLR